MEAQSIIFMSPEELSRLIVNAVRDGMAALPVGVGKKRLLTPLDVEKEIGLQRRTLEHWRTEGTGPEYTTVGGRIFYERTLLDEFITAGRIRPLDRLLKK
jgi:hypothetical protein